MNRIAIWSGKGGSGKTTTAINLAAALAEKGSSVLVLDLDGQASLTRALGVSPENGLLDAIRAGSGLDALARPTPIPGARLIPGGPEMDQAERILAGEVGADRLLDQAIAKTGPADWLLIDCSPGVSTLNVSALATARLHLAPVDARPISSETLGDTLALADGIRSRINAELVTRIVITRTTRIRASAGISEGIRIESGSDVLTTEIPERAALVDASAMKISVLEADPDNPASTAYRELADEVSSVMQGGE